MFESCENAIKNGYGEYKGFGHCSFCGSMNPVELAKLIEEGKAIMHGSDWKYGWPHKFYVDITNPNVGQIVQIGSSSHWENGKCIDEPIMGPDSPYIHLKFYSEHLALLDDDTFVKVSPIISNACGVTWEKNDGKLYYRSPYKGYQKSRF